MKDEAEAARTRVTKLEEDNKQLEEQVEDLQHELQNAFDERDRAVEAAEDKAGSASNEDVKRLENDILDLEAVSTVG
jgi:polyhydroxyalkanoate synthesis regulator phasin